MLAQLNADQEQYRPRIKIVTNELREPKGEGLEYLKERGIRGDLIRLAGIKWDGEQLFLPIWSPVTGERSWIRRKPGKHPNYSDGQPGVPYLFGKQDIKNRLQCTLVEGPFSLLSPDLWGKGFSLLGSTLDPRIDRWLRKKGFEKIYLWFDPDVTGYTKGNAVERQLREWHPNVVRVQGWLFDELDPGEHTPFTKAMLFTDVRNQGTPWPQYGWD